MSRFVQTETFDASPERLYAAIASSEGHAAFTGAPAEIGEGVGASWSAFGGRIHGVQIEAVPGVRLVQSWRAADWPEGTWSLVTFALEAHEGGARLTLTHDAVPDGGQAMLESGWNDRYWTPLRAWLAAG